MRRALAMDESLENNNILREEKGENPMINIEKEDSEKVGYDNRKLEESNARAD